MINSDVKLRYRIDIDNLSYHVECYGIKGNEDGSHVLLGSSPEEEFKVGYITIPARAIITVVGEVISEDEEKVSIEDDDGFHKYVITSGNSSFSLYGGALVENNITYFNMETLFIISKKTINHLMSVELKLDKKNEKTLDQIINLIKEYLINLGFNKDELIDNTMVLPVEGFVESLEIGEFIELNSMKWKVEYKTEDKNRVVYVIELLQNIQQNNLTFKKIELIQKKTSSLINEDLFHEISEPLLKLILNQTKELHKLKKEEKEEGSFCGDFSFDLDDKNEYKVEIDLKFKITRK